MPKSALIVEEKAWNAYPYTKTRYTCPFVEKFFLEIETKYLEDWGNTENVFQLSGADFRSRIVGQYVFILILSTDYHCRPRRNVDKQVADEIPTGKR